MMLLLILITLVVLALSINISEKNFYPRRNRKATNKSSYTKPAYSQRHNSQNYKSFVDDSFLLSHFMNHLKSKQEEKSQKIEREHKCKKKNNRILHWPKN